MNYHAMQVFGTVGAIASLYLGVRCFATIIDPRIWRLVIGRVRTGEWKFEEE